MSRAYALSIKQPWAALLVAGLKTIEVRSWPTRIRGRVFIHAARIPDERQEAWRWVAADLRPLTEPGGGIIGEAELIDCVRYTTAGAFIADCNRHCNEPDWFQDRGLYGFIFRNAAPLPFRRCPGNVRFFRVEDVG
jgi:hypothetical protein